MIHVIDLNFQGYPKAIAAFLVPTDEGLVLVETGPHSSLNDLLAGIESLGYRADMVKHVLLSHIHLDHAGAAWYFAGLGAKVYVHPLGLPHLINPQRLMSSATRIYGADMDRLWGQMNAINAEQLIAVEHQQTLHFGSETFTAWHTPGHAIHHVAWKYQDALFTGDVAGVKIFKGPVMPPCPPPDINIEQWESSVQLILNSDVNQLYLTHFGLVEQVAEHFDQLLYFLHDWKDWMQANLPLYQDLDSILPLFKNHVAQQLTNAGLTPNEAAVYEIANPSWMSVYGLSRYLKLKSS